MAKRGRSRGLRAVLVERKGGPLDARRAATRLSAYVYGNILVLGAVVAASTTAIRAGYAPLIVLGTGVTTYIAHVFADLLAHSSIPEAHSDEHGGEIPAERQRRLIADELRDAVPIMSSAIWPALALALGYHELIPTEVAALIAGGVVVVRIATVQLVSERVRGNPLRPSMFVGGLVTAAVAALIVLLKTLVGH